MEGATGGESNHLEAVENPFWQRNKNKIGQGTLKQVGIANAVHKKVITNQVLAENILAHQQEMEILRQELTHLKATATSPTAPQANAVVPATLSAPLPPVNQHDQLLQ